MADPDFRVLEIIEARLGRRRPPVDSGGEPPDDGRMEQRLTALETRFDTILPTLATKTDIESVKTEILRSTGETHKWMLGTVIGLFLGFGGLFLAMSNSLKPASSSSPPLIIYASPAASPSVPAVK